MGSRRRGVTATSAEGTDFPGAIGETGKPARPTRVGDSSLGVHRNILSTPGSDPRTEEPPAEGARETVAPGPALADSPAEEVRFEPSVPRAKESVSLAEGNWMRESLHLVPLVIGSRGVICVSAVGVSC